jgi:fucose permease
MPLMFPTIFALGIQGLGPNTKIGGSMIVVAIVAGAIFTPLMGDVGAAGLLRVQYVLRFHRIEAPRLPGCSCRAPPL